MLHTDIVTLALTQITPALFVFSAATWAKMWSVLGLDWSSSGLDEGYLGWEMYCAPRLEKFTVGEPQSQRPIFSRNPPLTTVSQHQQSINMINT